MVASIIKEVNVQESCTKDETYVSPHMHVTMDILEFAVIPKFTHSVILIYSSQRVDMSSLALKRKKWTKLAPYLHDTQEALKMD